MSLNLVEKEHQIPFNIQENLINFTEYPSLVLSKRELCDLELLLNGGYCPLKGFLTQNEYSSVLEKNCLPNGSVWPMPIMLSASEQFAERLSCDQFITLKNAEGHPLALMKITSIWQVNKEYEARQIYDSLDEFHPGVNYLFNEIKNYYLGGEVFHIKMPTHYDFCHLRLDPQSLKARFQELGWERIIGFQTRNPLHRAHYELTLAASNALNASILLHPSVGQTKPGDVDHFTRVRSYEKLLRYYPKNKTLLSLLPLAMRMAGPREALWHALIRKNYGCTHFIIGRDHAGPGKNKQGKDFYEPYAAQALAKKFEADIGIEIVCFDEFVYSVKRQKYLSLSQLEKNEEVHSISGTKFREILSKGETVPSWFSFPEVIEELKAAYPPKVRQGFTLFFTGLSGSGKSTIAQALEMKLPQFTHRKITLLDGDIVRQHFSSGLGFSKEDRDKNVSRVGFVANEITKHGGIAIMALIAPYHEARDAVRCQIQSHGGFFEIYISTSLRVCEDRDPKGLYSQARKGKITHFTGIDSPYEKPCSPDITLDTSNESIESSLDKIIDFLITQGYLHKDKRNDYS